MEVIIVRDIVVKILVNNMYNVYLIGTELAIYPLKINEEGRNILGRDGYLLPNCSISNIDLYFVKALNLLVGQCIK